MRKALDTESPHLAPPGADQHSAAAVMVARHARDKDDLAGLLGALGLPSTEDDLVRLLPLLPRADAIPTGDPMLTEAPTTYTAVAASMLRNSDDPEHVRTTLGLSVDELAAAHRRHADTSGAADVPTPAAASGPGRTAELAHEPGITPTDGAGRDSNTICTSSAAATQTIWHLFLGQFRSVS